ncbi:MAG: hypothetical protein AMS17_14205 [Spirochaetes bacterium DG_61]|nr:MAG: hypothetical protein AMS17_14205 [Spirochaetes bacterium DG_61]
MIFGKVTGTVISTRKSDTTEGTKYLLVQLCTQKETLKSSYLVALDLVGAGPGEMVIVSQGSSARVDLVEEGGKVVYRKDKTA